MPVGAGSSNQVIQLVVTTSKCTHILKSLADSRAPPTPSFIFPSQSTLLYPNSLCHQHLFFPSSLCCLHQAQFHPSHPNCSWWQSPSTGLGGESEPFDPTLRNGLQSCSHRADGRNRCENQGNKSTSSFSPRWETDGCPLFFLLIHRIISSGKKRAAPSLGMSCHLLDFTLDVNEREQQEASSALLWEMRASGLGGIHTIPPLSGAWGNMISF